MVNSLFGASAPVCVLVSIVLWRLWNKRHTRLPLPPGPRRLPIVGNLLDVRGEDQWEVARKWGEKYGPVVYAELLGSKFIFLNTYQAAVDLLDKRSANYASRPGNVMCELEGWTEIFAVVMKYGDELKQSRQMLHRFLQPAALGEYLEIQTRSTHKALEKLLSAPDEYFDLIRYAAGEAILMVSYGYQVAEKDDPFISLAEIALNEFIRSLSFFPVNALPWLQYLPSWFPGTEFQKIAKKGREYAMKMLNTPHDMVKKRMLDGTAIPSMSSKLMEANTQEDGAIKDEELIAKTTSVTYAGGSVTTVAGLWTFLLAMVLYPEVQRRAQEEIDKVVGKNSLPSFSDRPNLPYVDAICKECLRWQPIVPLGLPHTVAEDDEYNGYHIPAGTTVLSNMWAVTRDPNEYENPEEFMPERWLPKDGKKPPLDSYSMSFGFGRRVCPGRHFADNTMFIGMASTLAAFTVSKALDENGNPITPDINYTSDFIRHPKKFKYSLKPRSPEMVEVIHQAVESAK